MEEGGKVGFLEEDESVILKKNPTLQTPGYPTKEKVQRKSKKGTDKARRAAAHGASGSSKIGLENVIMSKAYMAELQH